MRLRSAQDDEPARALARAAKRGGVRGGRSGKGEGERERRAGALDSDSAGSHSTISFYKKTYKDGLFDRRARVALLHFTAPSSQLGTSGISAGNWHCCGRAAG